MDALYDAEELVELLTVFSERYDSQVDDPLIILSDAIRDTCMWI